MNFNFPFYTLRELEAQTGLPYSHLWRLAKKIGQTPLKGYPQKRTTRYDGVDWSRPLGELAKELGVSRQAVSAQRAKQQKADKKWTTS